MNAMKIELKDSKNAGGKKKLYCGNKKPVPPGYDGIDTHYGCLRKGIGVGLHIHEKKQGDNGPKNGEKAIIGSMSVPRYSFVKFAKTLGVDVKNKDISEIVKGVEKKLKQISGYEHTV